jgi:DNA (cytosine-5)-methyltransferase 1
MENEIKYFSMFTGVGGFEYGFESTNNRNNTRRNKGERKLSSKGKNNLRPRDSQSIINKSKSDAIYKCVGFSETDKYCNQVLKYKFPEIKNYGDATKINPKELPEFDLLCGGTPCQDFSIAGKRKGLHKEDGSLTRSGLFYHFIRIAKAKKPKIILMENVKGMLSSKNKYGEYNFESMMEAICKLGYVIDFTILNSKFFGVPQNRERVFIIAIRKDKIQKEKII